MFFGLSLQDMVTFSSILALKSERYAALSEGGWPADRRKPVSSI